MQNKKEQQRNIKRSLLYLPACSVVQAKQQLWSYQKMTSTFGKGNATNDIHFLPF